jgi:hypothetical protein
MDALREVIATLYLASAYAGGPNWLDKANEMLAENARDPEMGCEAARMLRILSEQSKRMFPEQPSLPASRPKITVEVA